MISVIDDTRGSQPTEGVPSRLPLRVSSVDLLGLEGIDTTHALLRRTLRVSHRVIEIWVQFGHLHPTRADVRLANDALAGVEISPLRRIVLLDAAGRPFTRIAVDGDVSGAGSDGAGGWYVGGTFRHVAGHVHVHLAHIFANGSVDPRWRATVDRHSGAYGFGVEGIVRLGAHVYVSGTFQFADGVYRSGLASLDARTGALARSWTPLVPGWSVLGTITTAGRDLALAGCFRVGRRYDLVAVDPRQGRIDPRWGPLLTPAPSPCAYGEVDAVASSRDAIYLIGAFRAGDRRDFVGVSRQSGKLIGAFGPPDLAGRDGQLLSLAVAAGRLFVSYSAGASQRLGLVALDPRNGAVVRSWRARPCGLGGGSLTAAGGRLYVWTHRLCALDASTGRQDPTWTPPADMLVTTVAASGSRLLVAS
jgi:hypothetical protein